MTEGLDSSERKSKAGRDNNALTIKEIVNQPKTNHDNLTKQS